MSEGNRWYESFPDFTQGETPEEQAKRLAHTIKFMADPDLGEPAIVLMTMINWNVKLTLRLKCPTIVERAEDVPPYYQVTFNEESNTFLAELSAPGISGVVQTDAEMELTKSFGWLEPNSDSPNWHREYPADTSTYQIAADGAESYIKGFAK